MFEPNIFITKCLDTLYPADSWEFFPPAPQTRSFLLFMLESLGEDNLAFSYWDGEHEIWSFSEVLKSNISLQAISSCHVNPYFKTFKTTNAFTQHRKPQLFEVSFDSCRLTAKGSFLQNFLRSSSVFPRAYCNPLIFNYSPLLKNLVCHHLLSLLFFLLLWRTTLTLPDPHPTITMCVIFIWLWTLPSFARFAISLYN